MAGSRGRFPEAYGWTGAINTIDFLQSRIREFTANNNQLLGKYFGGKGWPLYNIPNPTNDPNAPLSKSPQAPTSLRRARSKALLGATVME